MGRVNETQTHGDAPKFPFPPIPGPGGWWPGTVSVIRAASLRYFDVRSRKWSMRKGTKTRFVVRREGPHPPLPWWIENTIFCEVLWVSAHVPSAGRPLPPAPSALKPACVLNVIKDALPSSKSQRRSSKFKISNMFFQVQNLKDVLPSSKYQRCSSKFKISKMLFQV